MTKAGLRGWRVGLTVLFCLAFLVFGLLQTVSSTVLDAEWYEQVLDENDTYARVYNQVLVDPEFKPILTDLTASLPIDRSVIASNLRLVIPPNTLRGTIRRALRELTEYLKTNSDELDLQYLIGDIGDNLHTLEQNFAADIVNNLTTRVSSNLEEFATSIDTAFDQYERGEPVSALPTIEILPGLVDPMTSILVEGIDLEKYPSVRPNVQNALAAGDLNAAVAVVLPHQRDVAVDQAESELDARSKNKGITIELDDTLRPTGNDPIVKLLLRIRSIVGTWLPIAKWTALLIAIGAMVGLGFVARCAARPVAHTLGVTLVTGAGVLAAVWLVVRLVYGDPLGSVTGRSSGLPRQLRLLLGDLGDTAFSAVDGQIAGIAVVTATIGALILLGAWAIPTWREGHMSRGRKIAVVAVVALVLLAFLNPTIEIRFGGTDEDAVQRCNGSEALCDRPLDEVVFAGTHNAMSSSDNGFFSANQDLDIDGQLALGVRALLIDVWHWDTEVQLSELLTTETLPATYVSYLKSFLGEGDPPRPGTWWCHGICRLGATRANRGFTQIREFLDENPDEVLMVIVEDHVPPAEVEAAVRASGLRKYAYTPSKDPSAEWPTLGELVDRNRRLVIFAEKQAGDTAWYRKGYDYMMETPYTFAKPADMSCAPKRGGKGKRLFLMNHWIQRAAPARTDAGLVNSERFVLDRARQCKKQRGQLPNIIAVDFADVGDVVGAVRALNNR